MSESLENYMELFQDNKALIGAAALGATFLAVKLGKRRTNTDYKRSIVLADDVTHMNVERVKGIIQVMCIDDIIDVINRAREENVKVIPRGTKHSMGGHCIARCGYIIDMTHMNRITSFDEENHLVTVQAGATWSDLIKYLNQFGQSPTTLQSYSSFAIGGTLSVNAHGITNDDPMINSVEGISLVMANGSVVWCSREQNRILFESAIGGFGLFGVIAHVTLRTVPNTKLEMRAKHLTVEEFDKEYNELLEADDIGVKLGRINITNMSEVSIYEFRNKEGSEGTVSNLNTNPNAISKASQLMYKWIIPMNTVQKIRFKIEKIRGKPLDWSGDSERNELLYETATPMAELYSPLIKLDRTHILQEYFIPKDRFVEWMNFMRTDFLAYEKKRITLLNITIRFVRKDTTSRLPYAQKDVYAFVFYYRMHRTLDEDNELEILHNMLVNKSLELGGTFYLPYRFHYSKDQLQRGHPGIGDLFALKKLYDPEGVFSNMWYEKYNNTDTYSVTAGLDELVLQNPVVFDDHLRNDAVTRYDGIGENAYEVNSYCKMFTNPVVRGRFEEFLKHIFNVYPQEKLVKQLRLLIQPGNIVTNDCVFNSIKQFVSGFRNGITITRGSLRSLKEQKKDIVGQVKRLLDQTNLSNGINGQMCIGDPGRYAKMLKKTLRIKGKTYILHDRTSWMDLVERGSMRSVGKVLTVDFDNLPTLDIPDGSLDLVTCFPGLHHYSYENIEKLLSEIQRVLRPGGRFMLREHNAHEDLKPLLVCAHNIFNAVTGVTYEDEKKERREFRTIREWRKIVEEYGFTDKQIYELQQNDPTEDYLMLFVKDKVPELENKDIFESDAYKSAIQPAHNTYYTLPEWYSVDIVREYWAFLNHTPWFEFPNLRVIGNFWKMFYHESRHVRKNHGIMAAYFSEYFIMNAVIGSVTSFVFLQMALLAIGPRMVYTKPKDAPPETRMVVSHANVDVMQMDDDIVKNIEVLKENDRFMLLEIFRYTKFNETVLHCLDHGVRFYSIAGHKRVQLKIKASPDAVLQLEDLLEDMDCNIITEYRILPTSDAEYGVDVQVEYMNEIKKVLDENGYSITHIFEF